MEFTKQGVRALRAEIDYALRELGEKRGVKIHAGGCTFSDTEVNFKLHVETCDTSAVEEANRQTWERNCTFYGFAVSDFGKKFYVKDKGYRIVGLNLKRPKYSLKAERLTDKKIYLFDAEQIARNHFRKAEGAVKC